MRRRRPCAAPSAVACCCLSRARGSWRSACTFSAAATVPARGTRTTVALLTRAVLAPPRVLPLLPRSSAPAAASARRSSPTARRTPRAARGPSPPRSPTVRERCMWWPCRSAPRAITRVGAQGARARPCRPGGGVRREPGGVRHTEDMSIMSIFLDLCTRSVLLCFLELRPLTSRPCSPRSTHSRDDAPALRDEAPGALFTSASRSDAPQVSGVPGWSRDHPASSFGRSEAA